MLVSNSFAAQVVRAEEIRQCVEKGRRLGLPERLLLQTVKGTTAYYAKLREDLAAHRRWLGPEAFLLTLTHNTRTYDSLAAWVVHQSAGSTLSRGVNFASISENLSVGDDWCEDRENRGKGNSETNIFSPVQRQGGKERIIFGAEVDFEEEQDDTEGSENGWR